MLPEEAAVTVFECPDGFEEVDEKVIDEMFLMDEDDSCEVKVVVVVPNDVDGQQNQQLVTLDLPSNGDQMQQIEEWHSTSYDGLFDDVIEEVIEEVQLDAEEGETLQNFDEVEVLSNVAVEVEVDNKIEENNMDEDVPVEKLREYFKETADIEKHYLSGFDLAIPCTDDSDNDNNNDAKDPLQMEINIEDSPVSSKSASRKSKNGIELLMIYPAPPSKGGISLNTEDYKCLGEDTYLNDVIIDFYLKYIYFEMLSPVNRQRTHIFSSHFFTRLSRSYAGHDGEEGMTEDKRRHAGVQRWTKNVNIFEKDFVVIPVNEYSHWYLVIICFANLVGTIGTQQPDCFISEEEVQRPCLLVFDSLGSKDKFRVANTLRSYLCEEYLTKMGEEKDFNRDTIKTVYVKVPQQTNATDCGLYVLQYAENFFKNPIQDFTLPFIDLSNWFERIVIVRKRQEIAELITDLAIEFSEDKSVNLPEVKFPKYSETTFSDNEDNLWSWKSSSQSHENPYEFVTTGKPAKNQLNKDLFNAKSTTYYKRNTGLSNNKSSLLKGISQDVSNDDYTPIDSESDKSVYDIDSKYLKDFASTSKSCFDVESETTNSKRPVRKAVMRSTQIQEKAKSIKGRKRNEDSLFYKKNNSTISDASKFPGKGKVLGSSPWMSKNSNNSKDSLFSLGVSTERFYNYSITNERAVTANMFDFKFKRIKKSEEHSDSS